jgi:hypothetical protein
MDSPGRITATAEPPVVPLMVTIIERLADFLIS